MTRNLNSIELEELLETIPEPVGLLQTQRTYAHQQIKKVYRNILSKIEIVPEGIPLLKEKIETEFKKSFIMPKMAVGIWSAESQGHTLQQTALDAFHKSGQASGRGAVSNLERIKELYSVVKSAKNSSCEIHFKEPMTYDKIYLEMRPKLVEITVGALVEKDFDLEFASVFFDNGLPYWYDIYFKLTGFAKPEINDETRFLRLKFNNVTMLEFKITLFDIVKVLNTYSKGIYQCIPSPQHHGYIDIWPLNENIEDCVKEKLKISDAVYICFNDVIIPNLDKMIIKGIEKIIDIYPMKQNKWQIFKGLVENTPKGIKINAGPRFAVSGVTWNEVIELISKVTTIIEYNESESWIIIRDEIKEIESKLLKDYKEDLQHHYAVSDGSNLQKILSLPFVQAKGTMSNDPTEVLKVLGIDAATNILAREILSLFDFSMEKTPMNIRHIYLSCEFTSFLGILLPNNHAGILKQNRNTLSASSVERQYDTIFNNSILGVTENIEDVASSITVNKRVDLGQKAYETKIVENKPITINELKDRIKDSDNVANKVTEEINRLKLRKFYQDDVRILMGDDSQDEDNEQNDELYEENYAFNIDNVADGTKVIDDFEEINSVPMLTATNAIDSILDRLNDDLPFILDEDEDNKIENNEYKEGKISTKHKLTEGHDISDIIKEGVKTKRKVSGKKVKFEKTDLIFPDLMQEDKIDVAKKPAPKRKSFKKIVIEEDNE